MENLDRLPKFQELAAKHEADPPFTSSVKDYVAETPSLALFGYLVSRKKDLILLINDIERNKSSPSTINLTNEGFLPMTMTAKN